MTCKTIVVGLSLLVTLPRYGSDAAPAALQTCVEQKEGTTSDKPPNPVVICQKLFPSAPYVHLPQDQHAADGQATINGVVELDISPKTGHPFSAARLYDRDLNTYEFVDTNGQPITETSPLMKKNHFPSNRVHFLVYEARGKLLAAESSGTSRRLQLTGLRPIILVDGEALDGRFVGVWEGVVSKRLAADKWYMDIDNPEHVARVRITFAPPFARHTPNIGVLEREPVLPDGKRFEVTGTFDNATQPVRLSTGECAPPMNSYGAANPLPDRVATKDYSLRMWRFPAMHGVRNQDYHIVFNYPEGLHPAAMAMARDHNFRLKDYIATSTEPKALVYGIHANPMDQILFQLKPVEGGGGACQ